MLFSRLLFGAKWIATPIVISQLLLIITLAQAGDLTFEHVQANSQQTPKPTVNASRNQSITMDPLANAPMIFFNPENYHF
jgi:hypothetical protein